MAGEIFISYRRSDQDKARLLHALLKQRGVDAWYDALVGAGEDWRLKTAQALNTAPIFVLLFSKVASESQDISKELAAATFSNKLVIPVRLEDIKPEGAFLYELASRNWFDAFEDTEARFEILADKLAALVRGGPEAEVAAFNLGAPQPPPVIKPAPKLLFKRPAVLGGIAAAGVALIAAVAMFAMGPQAGQAKGPASQRIAFFGFTVDGDDPTGTAATVAKSAADQMFETMGVVKLDTVARDETLGTPPDKRLTRADELGALYALGGEVRPDTDGMTLSVRLVDVPSQMTLWEQSFSGPASEAGYLPAQASFPANEIMRCIVRYRLRQTQDTSQVLKLVAERCRLSANLTPETSLKVISAARGLAQAEPSSAFMHAYVVITLAISLPSTPASARPARIAEAEAALKRAIELEPKEPFLILARARFAEAKALPLAEYDATLLDLVAQAEAQTEGNDTIVRGVTSSLYASLLRNAGRWREAMPYLSAAAANDPLLGAQSIIGPTSAALGQSSRAQAEYERWFAFNPTAVTWSEWTTSAIFLGAGDAEAMLQSPPSFVPKSVVACYREIQKAYVSKDPKARSLGAKRAGECGDAGDLSAAAVLTTLVALGDLDRAFALVSGQPMLNSSISLYRSISSPSAWSPSAMFLPTSRAMRADPRFLPLVEKLGLMEYWRATKTQPDACETEDVPFCRELKASAQAGR